MVQLGGVAYDSKVNWRLKEGIKERKKVFFFKNVKSVELHLYVDRSVVVCCGTESLSQTKDSFFNVFFQLSSGGRQTLLWFLWLFADVDGNGTSFAFARGVASCNKNVVLVLKTFYRFLAQIIDCDLDSLWRLASGHSGHESWLARFSSLFSLFSYQF